MTKQTAALKEVNTSRIKIYEQLEISIQDLEHSKDVLSRQNAADKKQIKRYDLVSFNLVLIIFKKIYFYFLFIFFFFSLLETITTLETRCEDLQGSLDRVSAELEYEKRRVSNSIEATKNSEKTNLSHDTTSLSDRNEVEPCTTCATTTVQLQELKATNSKDQKIIEDLKEQVSLLLQVLSISS